MPKSKTRKPNKQSVGRPQPVPIASQQHRLTPEQQIFLHFQDQITSQMHVEHIKQRDASTDVATMLQPPTRQPRFAIIRLGPTNNLNPIKTGTPTPETNITPTPPTQASTTTIDPASTSQTSNSDTMKTETLAQATTTTTAPTDTTTTTTALIQATIAAKTATTNTCTPNVVDVQTLEDEIALKETTEAAAPKRPCCNFSETERTYILIALAAARERLEICPEDDKISHELCEVTRTILNEPRYRGSVIVNSPCQPTEHTIRNTWQTFKSTGKVGRKTLNTGRKKDLVSREKIMDMIKDRPRGEWSVRSVARESGTSAGTVCRVIDEMKKAERSKKIRSKPQAKVTKKKKSD